MEWEECETADGETYFYNPTTDETSWQNPNGRRSIASVRITSVDPSRQSCVIEMTSNPMQKGGGADRFSMVPSAWEECETAEGDTYYYNNDTEETRWSMPQGFRVGGVTSRTEKRSFVSFLDYKNSKKPKVCI